MPEIERKYEADQGRFLKDVCSDLRKYYECRSCHFATFNVEEAHQHAKTWNGHVVSILKA